MEGGAREKENFFDGVVPRYFMLCWLKQYEKICQLGTLADVVFFSYFTFHASKINGCSRFRQKMPIGFGHPTLLLKKVCVSPGLKKTGTIILKNLKLFMCFCDDCETQNNVAYINITCNKTKQEHVLYCTALYLSWGLGSFIQKGRRY